MAQTISVSTRKRGFFGQVFRILFFLFNGLMLLWLVDYFMELSKLHSEAGSAGATIGSIIGTSMLLTIWVLGLIIFGGLMLATRGKLITTTKTVE